MRVLQVLDISIPMLAGYTSRSRYIVNNQRALGFDPVVLTSGRHDNPTGCSMEVLDEVRYHRTNRAEQNPLLAPIETRPGLSEGLEVNQLRRRIMEVAERERPDIIHAHSSIMVGIPAFLAARQLGIPVVYEIRAFWEDAAVDAGTNREGSSKYRVIQAAETQLAKNVDALIGICEGIKSELILRGLHPDDVFVVPNGVEVDRFVPMARDPEIERKYGLAGKKVVSYIGTFAEFEGVPLLVQALVQLMKSGRDDLAGLIVGSGRTYETCREIAEAAGLGHRIMHPGQVPHSEVKPLYSVVDVLAYPRLRKRITELVTPLKPLEAMAMEKGVIGSDVGGLTELISDGETGLIHRAEDVGDLARQIERLVDDDALRAQLGRNGRLYVIRERNWRSLIERHSAVYERAKENWEKRRHMHQAVARLNDLLPFRI